MKRKAFVILCVLLLPILVSAQKKNKNNNVPKEIKGYERKVLNLNIKGIKDKALYLKSTKSGKKPLLIYLHGAGGRNKDASKGNSQFAQGFSQFDLTCDVVQPGSPGMWSAKAIDELIDHMIKTYDINSQKVYIAGMSMGGAGTWYCVFEGKRPVAAYMPLGSGASKTGKVHEKWDINKVGNKNIWMIHGDKDKVVPFANAKQSADLIAKVSPNFKFTALPGVGHSTGTALRQKETLEWFFKHSSK